MRHCRQMSWQWSPPYIVGIERGVVLILIRLIDAGGIVIAAGTIEFVAREGVGAIGHLSGLRHIEVPAESLGTVLIGID